MIQLVAPKSTQTSCLQIASSVKLKVKVTSQTVFFDHQV